MAEELIMNVKSDIKSVTKDTEDWGKTLEDVNESLDIQKKVIIDLEKELIKLKAKQDAIPKGAWVKGMDDLNDKIKQTSSELKLEKNALKDLTNQQSKASSEVKKFNKAQKDTNKEIKSNIGDFQVFGVSLNGVKNSFGQIIPTAKKMFGTIRAGIMSTGIGALVIAVVALMQSFKRSEEGQERWQRIMAAIGAVTAQVMDAFADLGGIIIDTFQDPLPAMQKFGKGLLKFLRDPSGEIRMAFVKATLAYKDFEEQTLKESEAMVEVTKARQKAHHIHRKLQVERAKADRKINDIRLKAEDREKFNATERIALLREAQAVEEDITNKEIKAKKLLVDAQKLEMEQGKNTIEDKDKLAQLQAELIKLDTKKLRSQRLLQTQITTALNEEAAAKQKLIDDEEAAWAKKISDNDKWNKKQLDDAKKVADTKMAILKAEEAFRKATIQKGFGAAAALAGENVALSKGIAAAQTIYNTQQGIMAAMAATSVGDKLMPYPLRLANAIATGVMGAAALKNIMSTNPTGGGIGGGGAVVASSSPAPQMMSGAFELTGGVEPDPIQAYVLTDEMTNSQNQLANIRRRATI